ncbi:MAG: protein kinase domain-containing protein [Gemmatimonadales bacterium]
MTVRPAAEILDRLKGALASRYELGEELGRGGMAIVYRARDRIAGRTVAIKVLRPEIASALGTARFIQEIRIEGALSHPNIVPLLEAGEVDGNPYCVMPLVEGESLRSLISRERQLAMPMAVRIAAEIADALACAHGSGVVHRDIKPENVMIKDARPIVLDFGIARAVARAANEALTSSGLVIGTPSYMSPEQAGGDWRVDARSDLYAVGCVLYEMLIGEPPFTGPTARAIMARHASEPLPSLRVVRPNVPPALEAAVHCCLAKVPADRFPSAAALAARLREIDLTAPLTPSRFRGQARGRTLRIAIAATVAAASLLLWLVGRPRKEPDSNRIVVFPLNEVTAPGNSSHPGEGERTAIAIGSALEHTEPLRWLDGWSRLNDTERRRVGGIDVGVARRIAGAERARFFLTGTVLRTEDSVRVVLQLHDVTDDAATIQESAAAAAAGSSSIALALAALVRIAPRMTGLEQMVNISPLVGRNPAAILNWLQGEQAYRRSRMDEAVSHLRAAVAVDPELAVAALRGAEAGAWSGASSEARELVTSALRHEAQLPPKSRALARALLAYLVGDADGAVIALRPALAIDPAYRDAWMLLGEVYLHLLPTIGLDSAALTAIPEPLTWPPDSLADDAFARVERLDPTFTPALQHRIEIALRHSEVTTATETFKRFRAAEPDSVRERAVALMVDCVNRGHQAIDWSAEGERDPESVYDVGTVLLPGPGASARACGIEAFRMLFALPPRFGYRWSALMALQGASAASGRHEAAVRLVDSAVTSGISAAHGLFVLDATMGVDVGPRADDFIAQLLPTLPERPIQSLWLIASWASHTGDRALLARATSLAQARRAAPHATRLDSVLARAIEARLRLALGDSLGAVALLERLAPTAPREDLTWSLWEPLAGERLLLARLLVARQRYARAHRVASGFDHPGIAVYDLFRPASLDVRAVAAERLGQPVLAEAHRRRLGELRANR